MFLVDHPNSFNPNGSDTVFKYNHYIRTFVEEEQSFRNKFGHIFKFYTPIRYDILLENLDYFYGIINNLQNQTIPVIFCDHESDYILEFVQKFTTILENNKQKRHFILITNCDMDLSDYKNYLTHLKTNHLLTFYTESMKDTGITDEQKIDEYLFTNKSKTFLSLNKNTTQNRIHRVRLLCWYYQNNLIEVGYISSIIRPDTNNKIFNSEYEQISILKKYYGAFFENSPMILDFDGNDESDLSLNIDSRYLYNETFFSIISETSFSNNKIFITEKTPKSIRNLHPFLILGDWKIHSKLKELGFVLYDNLIDYSFDDIEDNDLRFIKFTEEVQRLIDNKDKIIEWYKGNTDKLIHNFNHLKTNFNSKTESKQLLDFFINYKLPS